MNKLLVSNYNLYNAKGDVHRFLRRTRQECGSAGCRIFAFSTWGGEAREHNDAKLIQPSMPWEVVFWWHGFDREPPDLAAENVPMFDLNKPYAPWWERRREILETMADLDLELHEVIIDYCSLKDEWGARPKKFWHPFMSCVQRWGNAPPRSEDDLLIPDGLWTYDEALFGRWVKFVADLSRDARAILGGDRYYVETWNELGDLGWGAQNRERTIEWNRRFTERLQTQVTIPKSQLKISAGLYQKELSEQVGTFCIHGVCRPLDIQLDYGLPSDQVEISMDGGINGSGPANWAGGQMADAEQIVGIVRRMKAFGYATLEGFDFNMERDSYSDFARSDVDKFDSAIFRMAAKEFLEKKLYSICPWSGKKPNPYCPDIDVLEYVPGTEPREVCDVHLPPPPEPEPDTRTCYEKYIAGRPMSKWQVGRYILCVLGLKK